ncbi:MAG: VOC family protein [Alphaproteobacteria bacterium]
MTFSHVGGLDHVVIMVDDLDRATADWAALGFTVSPRGIHSAHVGAANHTVVFENDYIELLGILRDTPSNAPSRAFLDRRGDGIERIALATDDAGAAADELRAAGIEASGPFAFGRPVPIPGGGEVDANFRIARWPVAAAPGGVRLFVCEHQTPDAVWRPELKDHPNTAVQLRQVVIATPSPRVDADQMAELIGGTVEGVGTPDTYRVPTGAHLAALVFCPRAAIAARFPGADADSLPERGAAAVVIGVRDPVAAARVLGVPATLDWTTVRVPFVRASGTLIALEAL